jgi:hypothetical protein
MNKILSTIRSEPIRAILYPVLVILIGTLVTKGILTDFSSDIVIGLIGAVLGVPAAEAARSKVWSPASVAKLTIDPDGTVLR